MNTKCHYYWHILFCKLHILKIIKLSQVKLVANTCNTKHIRKNESKKQTHKYRNQVSEGGSCCCKARLGRTSTAWIVSSMPIYSCAVVPYLHSNVTSPSSENPVLTLPIFTSLVQYLGSPTSSSQSLLWCISLTMLPYSEWNVQDLCKQSKTGNKSCTYNSNLPANTVCFM